MVQPFSAAIVTAIALTGSLALTPLAGRAARKFGAISRPDGKRRLHARPTPLWGGSAVLLACVLATAVGVLLAPGSLQGGRLPLALGASTGMLCLIGLYDDLFDMRARWKLLGQIVSTLPVVLTGHFLERASLLGHSVELGWAGIPLTIGWLVVGINALNLLDGMDGLASLIGIVISLAVGFMAAGNSRPELALMSFSMAGALAGFLVHNLPPARIYLGDCGSMVIGFALAVFALEVSLQASRTGNITVAAALLFVPLLDTAMAIVRRTLKGRSFFVADRSHVHHQLLNRGFSIWKVLGILGGFTLTTVAVAWWVVGSGHDFWGWIVLATVTLALTNRQLVAREEWELAKRFLAQTATFVARSIPPGVLTRPSSADRRPDANSTSPSTGPVILPAGKASTEGTVSASEKRKAA